MRVYIAGPMTGLPDFNYPAFHKAAAAWRALGWDVLNPAESFSGATDRPYREYVAVDMRLLASCDAIAMLPGWDGPGARGSVWEHAIASERGLAIYDAERPVPPTPKDGKATNPKDAIGSDKMPLHLWPTTATVHGCLALLDGASKYGRQNFRAIGVRASIYYDAARRHLDAWYEGEDAAPDSGVHHLGHVLACAAIILDAAAAGKLNDDRAVAGGYHDLLATLTPLVRQIKERHADKSPKHYSIGDRP